MSEWQAHRHVNSLLACQFAALAQILLDSDRVLVPTRFKVYSNYKIRLLYMTRIAVCYSVSTRSTVDPQNQKQFCPGMLWWLRSVLLYEKEQYEMTITVRES